MNLFSQTPPPPAPPALRMATADTRPLLVLHALPLRSALRPYRAPAVR
jgi:hypothetical protein